MFEGAFDSDVIQTSQGENHGAYIDGGRNGFRPHGPASTPMSACLPVALCQSFLCRRVPAILFVMDDGHETRVQQLLSPTLLSAHRLKGHQRCLQAELEQLATLGPVSVTDSWEHLPCVKSIILRHMPEINSPFRQCPFLSRVCRRSKTSELSTAVSPARRQQDTEWMR